MDKMQKFVISWLVQCIDHKRFGFWLTLNPDRAKRDTDHLCHRRIKIPVSVLIIKCIDKNLVMLDFHFNICNSNKNQEIPGTVVLFTPLHESGQIHYLAYCACDILCESSERGGSGYWIPYETTHVRISIFSSRRVCYFIDWVVCTVQIPVACSKSMPTKRLTQSGCPIQYLTIDPGDCRYRTQHPLVGREHVYLQIFCAICNQTSAVTT